MQKYEREIVELLERLETEEAEAPTRPIRRDHRPPQLPRRRRTSVLSSLRSTLARGLPSPGQLMAFGFGLLVLAWLLPLGRLEQWVQMAGVLLFLGAIVLGLLSGGRVGREEKTWRGRSLEPERPTWGEMKARMEDSARDFKRRFRRRY